MAVISETVAIAESFAPGVAADFAELYESHYWRVVRALELGGLDRASAEDTAQESFARTLAHWRRVRTGSNPPGYVYTTAFRLSRRVLRREEFARAEMTEAGPGDIASETATVITTEASLASMPIRRRSCAVLCLVIGLSPKEAARTLGIAEGTVRKQLELARKALREALS